MEQTPSKEQTDISYGQYDTWGKDYVKNEKEFYTGKSDPTREFFKNALGGDLHGKVLADIGCGAGDELIEYAQMGAVKVIGIEPSSTMRHIAEELVKSESIIELMPGEFTSLPLENESVDVVTARYSLHIISDFSKAFEEIARVLKPNGLFLVAVSHPQYDARVAEKQGKAIGERVQIKLFKGTVTLDNATHSMEDYTGDVIAKHFVCENILEYAMGSKKDENTDLVLQYRKK